MVALSKDGSQHVTDEKINTISHLVAACFAILGAGLLIARAAVAGDPWQIVAASIYSAALVGLFVFSTLHHGVTGSEKVNNVLRTFDYLAVFTLIAGTVTPLVLMTYRDAFGWAVLGAVWLIAAVGITLRASLANLPKYITNTLYIVLGWLPTVLVLDHGLPLGALALLAGGGVLYTIGFAVFVLEKPNPLPGRFGFHEIWHIVVALAALCHYILMYLYVL